MSPGWANVQDGLACAVGALTLAGGELRAGETGPDAPALQMARLCLAVVENLYETSRRWVIDEAVLEAERARAYAAGYEACKADRCRMQVIDGGRAGPHLAAQPGEQLVQPVQQGRQAAARTQLSAALAVGLVRDPRPPQFPGVPDAHLGVLTGVLVGP